MLFDFRLLAGQQRTPFSQVRNPFHCVHIMKPAYLKLVIFKFDISNNKTFFPQTLIGKQNSVQLSELRNICFATREAAYSNVPSLTFFFLTLALHHCCVGHGQAGQQNKSYNKVRHSLCRSNLPTMCPAQRKTLTYITELNGILARCKLFFFYLKINGA